MAISLSKANPIRFAKVNNLLPSFDNTLFDNEEFAGITNKYFKQQYEYKEDFLIQIKADLTETPVMTVYINGAPTVLTADNVEVYTSFKIWEYFYSFNSANSELYFTAVGTTDTYQSEPICIVDDLTGFYKIEWYNLDPPTANNNFEFDYSTTLAKANVNHIWVEPLFFSYTPSGESTVYDNQNEKEIIKRSLFRNLNFQSDPIPRYFAEMLTVYMAHDVFVVNDIQYVAEELPEVEAFGGTNVVQITANLTDKNVLGLNTYDTGFSCSTTTNDEIMNLELKGVSGAQTLSVPEGYLIQSITAYKVTGTPTIKAGSTVGGQDLMYPSTVTVRETSTVNQEIAETGINTIYLDISGVGATANIYVILILNRQT